MSQDFSTWTRDDYNAFDNRRQTVFQPTPEEQQALLVQQETDRQNLITSKLLAIGVQRPAQITKEFVLGMMTQMNAQQFVGEDLSLWIDNQVVLFGSLEVAFEDLILRYL